MRKKWVRITHLPSGERLAEGPLGWGITPFEGNFYVGRKYLLTAGFKPNFIPGVCFYKFLYVWLDFVWKDGRSDERKSKNLGWFYWLPNPLFPFIWFRVALPGMHPELLIEEFDRSTLGRLETKGD